SMKSRKLLLKTIFLGVRNFFRCRRRVAGRRIFAVDGDLSIIGNDLAGSSVLLGATNDLMLQR
ncbi:hypothetical protein OII53_30580, partial [Achromobacter ruhlandii]|uniref:hypothetical protein n=1 Tax=Achromobacter ruhlandii TaxID=72557 RepID=UPI0021F0ED7F